MFPAYLLETLTGLLWIIAGPLMTLAGLLLLAIGAHDRDKPTILDGAKAFAFGLIVCALLVIWTRYATGA
jgi:hypothetical protein